MRKIIQTSCLLLLTLGLFIGYSTVLAETEEKTNENETKHDDGAVILTEEKAREIVHDFYAGGFPQHWWDLPEEIKDKYGEHQYSMIGEPEVYEAFIQVIEEEFTPYIAERYRLDLVEEWVQNVNYEGVPNTAFGSLETINTDFELVDQSPQEFVVRFVQLSTGYVSPLPREDVFVRFVYEEDQWKMHSKESHFGISPYKTYNITTENIIEQSYGENATFVGYETIKGQELIVIEDLYERYYFVKGTGEIIYIQQEDRKE